MLEVRFKQGTDKLWVGETVFQASCDVRNELNGRRKSHEVVRSIPDGLPVMPRPFPKGLWNIGMPEARKPEQRDLWPFFIPTDAYLDMPVWELKDGQYYRPTGMVVRDRAYGLHHSVYATTLGCIRLEYVDDVYKFCDMIRAELASEGGAVRIEVT